MQHQAVNASFSVVSYQVMYSFPVPMELVRLSLFLEQRIALYLEWAKR